MTQSGRVLHSQVANNQIYQLQWLLSSGSCSIPTPTPQWEKPYVMTLAKVTFFVFNKTGTKPHVMSHLTVETETNLALYFLITCTKSMPVGPSHIKVECQHIQVLLLMGGQICTHSHWGACTPLKSVHYTSGSHGQTDLHTHVYVVLMCCIWTRPCKLHNSCS